MIYAHSSKNDDCSWHTLADHLTEVSALSGRFGSIFDAESLAGTIGLLHDLGKASAEFQARLKGGTQRVDHSTAGGQWAFDSVSNPLLASLLAFPVMGHHGGLPDGGMSRMEKGSVYCRRYQDVPDYSPGLPDLLRNCIPPTSLPWQIQKADEEELGFATAFFIRMMFSCLTDADWLDTERFCSPETYARRPQGPELQQIASQFSAFMDAITARQGANSVLQSIRNEVLEHCRTAALQIPGCFSLTVPTGGGKTLSSLAFALAHALRHGKRRIIYVIPFTSIIEQNAAVFRHALGTLGDVSVLEHHSSYVTQALDESDSSAPEASAELTTDLRLAVQNWDAPLVVTTAVQFFESLFDYRRSACRKLHNIADSVIILDEAQMLPPDLLNPCVAALRELIRGYGASIVLCTATQPALYKTANLDAGFQEGEIREIIPASRLEHVFEGCKRVSITVAGTIQDEDLVARLTKQHQTLCIVNTRGRAREVFQELGSDCAHYHLSALMYPEHRRRKLAEIRQRLKKGEACRVISTSLVEAGVDIDFPSVYREKTGLDSIAQAAGRCNREGRLQEPGMVTVFTPEKGLPRAPFFQRRAMAFDWVAERHKADLLCPEAIHAYFQHLYQLESLDKPGILSLLAEAVDPDLDDMPSIPFRQIARDFTFIADGSISLIVEQGEALEMLDHLEKGDDRAQASEMLRRLQSYTIQVYPGMLSGLAVRSLDRYGLVILSGATGYSEDMGLVPDAPVLREKEHNIF